MTETKGSEGSSRSATPPTENIIPPTPPCTPVVNEAAVQSDAGPDPTLVPPSPPIITEGADWIPIPKPIPGGDASAILDPVVEISEAPVEQAPQEIFLSQLKILPPLQKINVNPKEEGEEVIYLPPIRPEEPVSSLRAALGELVQYAHLTHYRFVVESSGTENVTMPSDTSTPVDDSAVKASSPSPSEQQPQVAKKKHKKKGNSKQQNQSKNSSSSSAKQDTDKFPSLPYTGLNAKIMAPHHYHTFLPNSGVQAHESKESEVVLDDYGDLTKYSTVGSLGDGGAFRIVLERYDVGGVKDHIMRLRNMLDGAHTPAVISLVDNGEGQPNAAAAGVQDVGEKEQQEEIATDEKEITSSQPADEAATQPEKTSTAQEKAQLAQQEKLREQARTAKTALPSFALDQSVSVDGTNLLEFYSLACGEEEGALSKSTAEHTSTSKAKSKKGKDGGNNASNQDDATAKNTGLAEYSRRMNELDRSVRTQWGVQYSGYHPPPPHRRVLGDLAYLEIAPVDGTSDKDVIYVTAVPTGFYCNRSTRRVFDPSPLDDDHCFSHELLDCLLKKSHSIRLSWSKALSAAKERAELMALCASTDSPLQALHRVATRGSATNTNHGGLGGGIDSVILRPSWLIPHHHLAATNNNNGGRQQQSNQRKWRHSLEDLHEYNKSRSEDDLANTFGMDLRAGALRDWNEELQTAREMATDQLNERVERARMIHKVLTDFGEAALIGAMSIFDGHILPMNPNEPLRSHVYLHNNIFFSRAVDAGMDTYKICTGDAAARKSTSRDASCTGALHRLDTKGLFTLATVVVDYLGTRLVCQSVVPGILHGEKSHTLLYGAVEAGTPLVSEEEMHGLLQDSLGRGLMVASRPVPTVPLSDEKLEVIAKAKALSLEAGSSLVPENIISGYGSEAAKPSSPITNICGPIEMKGIQGSDQRKYVLDLTRLTSRDANWVPESEGGTGNWEKELPSGGKGQKFVPKSVHDDEWTMAVLRPELITALTHKRMTEWLESKKAAREKSKEDQPKKAENKDGKQTEETTKDTAKEDPKKDEPSAKPEAKEEKQLEESNLKQLRDEDEIHLKTLRYNVNVFLPHTKSLEGLDDEAHAQILKDEERARDAASYIWNVLLPSLTKEIRDSSGHQIPVDGIALTEMLHARGINCRYLGRLAALAVAEEAADIEAELDVQAGKLKTLSRRSMPLCWLEIVECEMIARAAKHVLDSYLTEHCGSAALQPAQTIASFFSALLSSGEESAAETEVRINEQDKASNTNGSKQGKGKSSNWIIPDDDDVSALILSNSGGGGDAVPLRVRGRGQIWDAIETEVGRRFRYSLTLYNNSKTNNIRSLFLPLLRRLCQKTGVRLVARNYNLGGKCLCGGGGGNISASYPISPVDIVDVIPMVKHAAAQGEGFVPCSYGTAAGAPSLHILLPDAKATLEAAHMYWSGRALPKALDLAQEAASLYQRVVDTPLHASVARCMELTAVILFQAQEPELAAANASRSLAVAVQLGGFDCAEAVTAHSTLAHILLSSGDMAGGVKHLRAALYLMELMGGPRYAELCNVYHKLGGMYYESGMGIEALRFYQEAANRKSCDRMVESMVAKNTALVLAALGQFKPALENEKRAFGIYSLILGEDHELTKNSATNLQHFMRLAVEQSKRMAVEERKRLEEEAADAIASQIEATEVEEEEKKKKKKKKKHKKKN